MKVVFCGFKSLPIEVPAEDQYLVSQIYTSSDLHAFLAQVRPNTLLVVYLSELKAYHVDLFKGAVQKNGLRLLFVGESVESGFILKIGGSLAFSMSFVLQQSGVPSFSQLKRFALGAPWSRREVRQSVQSKAIIKSGMFSESEPLGNGVRVLLDGVIKDFSRHGAKVSVSELPFVVKEFVTLMYQDQFGKWVEIQAQVRWVESVEQGAYFGLQFMARSA